MSSDVSISKKKPFYIPHQDLLWYLKKYDRLLTIKLDYEDLKRFMFTQPILDKNGKDTLWVKVFYNENEWNETKKEIKSIYSFLKSGGNQIVHEHLRIESVDFCTFGNSKPFRVKIVNMYNDVHDYFYIKKSDSSRVYGLELEHLLSPNRIQFFANTNTLIEEHIVGIPGDVFMTDYLYKIDFNTKRLAKEFVKFNERCFIRLLGDMRAYNFVIDMTYDFDDIQFKIKPIDFDQQSYEGNHKVYLPQFFKENSKYVSFVLESFNENVIKQYQAEERSLIKRRIKNEKRRLFDLHNTVNLNNISSIEKTKELALNLFNHYGDESFLNAKTMADIVKISLRRIFVGK